MNNTSNCPLCAYNPSLSPWQCSNPDPAVEQHKNWWSFNLSMCNVCWDWGHINFMLDFLPYWTSDTGTVHMLHSAPSDWKRVGWVGDEVVNVHKCENYWFLILLKSTRGARLRSRHAGRVVGPRRAPDQAPPSEYMSVPPSYSATPPFLHFHSSLSGKTQVKKSLWWCYALLLMNPHAVAVQWAYLSVRIR